jgi:23S rRNA (pseudouridine1915-N3)-methyltransferase
MKKRCEIILTICGNPDKWALDAIEHWKTRIGNYANFQLDVIGSKLDKKVEKELMKRLSPGCIAFSRGGERLTNAKLASMFENAVGLHFFIGAANGLPPEFLEKCGRIVSMSQLTLQHDVAAIAAMEQIYRSLSIVANSPYHRGKSEPAA